MNRISKLCFASVALAVVPSVWAQCATGVNTGGGNCVPPDADGMPGYQGNAAPNEPPPKWVDSWGAIVIDGATGSAGTVTGYDSRREAERAAMHDCERKGARDCQVEQSYYNQCAAVAWGHEGFGTAKNPTEQGAQNRALQACNGATTQCKVVYSACSIARRVQ